MNPHSRLVIALLVTAAVAAGAFLWWRQPWRGAPLPSPVARATTAPMIRATSTGGASAVAPAPPPSPSIRHPIHRASTPPALDQSDAYIKDALVALLGKKSVLSFIVTEDFARRLVVTVNNLASGDAGAELWPVRRTAAGVFSTEPRAGGTAISAQNGERYAAFVNFVAAIDARRATAVYSQLYPVLQQAYEDVGFPGKYFNDRVVAVIDDLLATPDVPEPLMVKRVQVEGEPGTASSARSGGLYVFTDPALEAASTGQKILLRVGRANSAKLRAKLVEIRTLVATGNK